MKEYLSVLKDTLLFSGISDANILGLCDCLNAKVISYKKDSKIIWEDDTVAKFGVLVSGSARSVKNEVSGKLIIVTLINPGEYTGVLLAASRNHPSPVTVEATSDTKLLTFNIDKIVSQCTNACPRHARFLRNYMDVVAEKSMVLHDRIDCLIRHSVREKVLAYLVRISKEENSDTINIPFDRKEMSEYLNVERSALSRELSRMKRDGVIDFNRNEFVLL